MMKNGVRLSMPVGMSALFVCPQTVIAKEEPKTFEETLKRRGMVRNRYEQLNAAQKQSMQIYWESDKEAWEGLSKYEQAEMLEAIQNEGSVKNSTRNGRKNDPNSIENHGFS